MSYYQWLVYTEDNTAAYEQNTDDDHAPAFAVGRNVLLPSATNIDECRRKALFVNGINELCAFFFCKNAMDNTCKRLFFGMPSLESKSCKS